MYNSIKIGIAFALMLTFTACSAQIKNAMTESVKIYGNCGMCESKIENAGNVKKIAQVDWNKDNKMATLTYDKNKTTQEEILKRIALVGYDSDLFLAPDDVYAKLPNCCQYDRANKTEKVKIDLSEDPKENTDTTSDKNTEVTQNPDQLKVVFDPYFSLKDALVQSDGKLASVKAKELVTAINSVQMAKLSNQEHAVWMRVMKDLQLDAEHIAETKEIEHQRDHFNALSTNLYQLLKVTKLDSPTYLQHCPMANEGKGADWMSKENTVKNPYYGAQMLSCGKTVETIK